MLRTSQLSRKTPLRAKATMQRAAWKKRAPKKRAGHDAKIRNNVRGHQCYLQIPDLCRSFPEDETVVPCHPNWLDMGKGAGLKAPDVYTVPGCFACHYELDQGNKFTRSQKRAFWTNAYSRWAAYRDREAA